MRCWRDALRLALGTLTVLPVRPPARVDRVTAGAAMVLAPLVGAVLGLLLTLALWVLGGLAAAPPLLAAALLVGLLALLTRGMHLDGLADTADGLGSGRPAEEALAVMRRGDVGPFGVVTLVLVLLLQVAALAVLVGSGHALAGLGVACVVSRAALPFACRVGMPAARAEGLGATVAGTVSPGRLGVSAAVALLLAAAFVALDALATEGPAEWWALPLGIAGAALAAGWLGRHAVRRLGGVSGDVLGAVVEAGFTGALVLAALA